MRLGTSPRNSDQRSVQKRKQDGSLISYDCFCLLLKIIMELRRFAICLAIGLSISFAYVAAYFLTSEKYWRKKVTFGIAVCTFIQSSLSFAGCIAYICHSRSSRMISINMKLKFNNCFTKWQIKVSLIEKRAYRYCISFCCLALTLFTDFHIYYLAITRFSQHFRVSNELLTRLQWILFILK